MAENYFSTLYDLNVNDKVDQKKTGGVMLSYLSWPYAWAEIKKRFPDATYSIQRTAQGLPYVHDPDTGYMVFTTVTINGITHEMCLPVMDGTNKAMKSAPYSYTTRTGEKTVEAATMFDVNKAIMRCLVKNLAMHGLGLYIYAGEDLPEMEKPEPVPPKGPIAPPQEDTPIICENCKKRLPDWSNGFRLFKAGELAEDSKRRFGGKCLCAECQQTYNKGGT